MAGKWWFIIGLLVGVWIGNHTHHQWYSGFASGAAVAAALLMIYFIFFRGEKKS